MDIILLAIAIYLYGFDGCASVAHIPDQKSPPFAYCCISLQPITNCGVPLHLELDRWGLLTLAPLFNFCIYMWH